MPFNLSVSELISIALSSTLTDRVLPVFASPAPPVICPAPENCVNVSASLPSVAVPVTDVST